MLLASASPFNIACSCLETLMWVYLASFIKLTYETAFKDVTDNLGMPSGMEKDIVVHALLRIAMCSLILWASSLAIEESSSLPTFSLFLSPLHLTPL